MGTPWALVGGPGGPWEVPGGPQSGSWGATRPKSNKKQCFLKDSTSPPGGSRGWLGQPETTESSPWGVQGVVWGPLGGARGRPEISFSGPGLPQERPWTPGEGPRTPLAPPWASPGHFSRFLKSSKNHCNYVYLSSRGAPGPPHEGPWGPHGGPRGLPRLKTSPLGSPLAPPRDPQGAPKDPQEGPR